jgi:hypothetical protein
LVRSEEAYARDLEAFHSAHADVCDGNSERLRSLTAAERQAVDSKLGLISSMLLCHRQLRGGLSRLCETWHEETSRVGQPLLHFVRLCWMYIDFSERIETADEALARTCSAHESSPACIPPSAMIAMVCKRPAALSELVADISDATDTAHPDFADMREASIEMAGLCRRVAAAAALGPHDKLCSSLLRQRLVDEATIARWSDRGNRRFTALFDVLVGGSSDLTDATPTFALLEADFVWLIPKHDRAVPPVLADRRGSSESLRAVSLAMETIWMEEYAAGSTSCTLVLPGADQRMVAQPTRLVCGAHSAEECAKFVQQLACMVDDALVQGARLHPPVGSASESARGAALADVPANTRFIKLRFDGGGEFVGTLYGCRERSRAWLLRLQCCGAGIR